jgi:hypothetical protein
MPKQPLHPLNRQDRDSYWLFHDRYGSRKGGDHSPMCNLIIFLLCNPLYGERVCQSQQVKK